MHRYRLGVNYSQLAVNRPHAASVDNYNPDGYMRFDGNGGSEKNYEPNSFGGPVQTGQQLWAPIEVRGPARNHAPEHHPEDNDFVQAGNLYRLMSEAEKKHLVANIAVHLVANIAVHLSQVSKDDIIERSVSHFRNADRNYGDRVRWTPKFRQLAKGQPAP